MKHSLSSHRACFETCGIGFDENVFQHFWISHSDHRTSSQVHFVNFAVFLCLVNERFVQAAIWGDLDQISNIRPRFGSWERDLVAYRNTTVWVRFVSALFLIQISSLYEAFQVPVIKHVLGYKVNACFILVFFTFHVWNIIILMYWIVVLRSGVPPKYQQSTLLCDLLHLDVFCNRCFQFTSIIEPFSLIRNKRCWPFHCYCRQVCIFASVKYITFDSRHVLSNSIVPSGHVGWQYWR